MNASSPAWIQSWLWIVLMTATVPGRADLIGCWNFNDLSLRETSGFSPPGVHDGAAAGTIRFSEDVPAGFPGHSVEFVVTSGPVGIRVGNSSDKDPAYRDTFDEVIRKSGQFTLALWLKAAPQSGTAEQEKKASWRCFNGLVCKWGKRGGPDGGPAGFALRREGFVSSLVFDANQEDEQHRRVRLTGNLFDDRWHHVAVTRSGQTMTAYVDGVVVASTADDMAAWLPLAELPLVIGSETLNYRPLRGKLDEVRIYNEALDEAAVRRLAKP